jgi:esterase/lipase
MIIVSIVIILTVLLLLLMITGPRLDARWPDVSVPDCDNLQDLSRWLDEREGAVPGLIDGAGACISFARPDNPRRTPICFVYVHGFSATWPETAPVTERLANHFGANVFQARLAGHGTEPHSMVTPAENWLVSMAETWAIASQLGERIVIVATSTGAPLSVWLASQAQVKDRIHALLFMSPNFKIRNRFDFLLTAPLSRYWIHHLLGRERSWIPVNDAQAKYWTYRYSSLALIEMQKAVDWLKRQRLGKIHTPLALMYMKNDPTINPAAAIRGFARWGATHKRLIPVTVDGDAPDHVFCGDIIGAHRTDWVVTQFEQFLRQVPEPASM